MNNLVDSPSLLARATERLDNWRSFLKDFYGSDAPEEVAPLASVRSTIIAGTTVGIAALNTSWRSSGDGDRHQLLLSDRQVQNALALIADSDVRIIVMHHPLDWLAPWDADDARSAFERIPSLVLSGHDHTSNPTSEVTPRGRAVYSRAGCLYGSFDYFNGYSIIDLRLDASTVDISLRSWWRDRREFDVATHISSGGEVSLPWETQTKKVGSTVGASFSTVQSRLASIAHETSLLTDQLLLTEVAAVEDVLVEPRFWPLAPADLRAAAAAEPDYEPAQVDILPLLTERQVIIVSGGAQSGVTSALIWLLAKAFRLRDDVSPGYMTFDRKRKGPFDHEIRDALFRVGIGPDVEDISPRLIAVDDMQGRFDKANRRLIAHLAANPSDQLLLGTHDEHVDRVTDALEERGISYEVVHLGEFGRKELRALAKKVLGADTAEVVDRILGLMVRHELPRSPLVMTALVAVIANEADPTTLNESGVLDAYVALLLGQDDAVDLEGLGMDYRRREHLLGWLASLFAKSENLALPRLECETELVNYFKARGWGASSSPGQVLQSLISRRVLTSDVDGVRFRHPALLHLFLGKWMSEDKQFAAEALASPLKFASAIHHAAGLERTDKDLLRSVGAATEAAIEALSDEISVEMFDLIKDQTGWSDAQPSLATLKVLVDPPTDEDPTTEEDRDEAYERWFLERQTVGADFETPRELDTLIGLTYLLGGVLRSSELVDDVSLKADELKRTIRGWALLAVVMSVQNDMTSDLQNKLKEEFRKKNIDETFGDRLTEVVVTLGTGYFLVNSVGTVHLEGILVEVLEDDAFMAKTALALYATFLYAELRLSRWPARLSALQKRHGVHPVVGGLVRSTAMAAYYDPTTPDADAEQLESIIVSELVGDGNDAVTNALSADLRQQLRTRRTNAKFKSLSGRSTATSLTGHLRELGPAALELG